MYLGLRANLNVNARVRARPDSVARGLTAESRLIAAERAAESRAGGVRVQSQAREVEDFLAAAADDERGRWLSFAEFG